MNWVDIVWLYEYSNNGKVLKNYFYKRGGCCVPIPKGAKNVYREL